MEEGFRATQAELREEVFFATSLDGSVELELNGEGLAVRVSIDPGLLERGPAAIERGVMEAINDVAVAIQSHTTVAFQLAAAQYLGLPLPDDMPNAPPPRRPEQNA